jgi:dTDP-4-amino-4,6-dideoxygalactose transaminase
MKRIRVSKSNISKREIVAASKVIKSGNLGMGPIVNIFEKKLKVFFNRNVVCLNSGTAALHLALQACDIGLGDEVLVPSITYVASFQAITATGAKPVICDINTNNLIISLQDAKKKITKKTKAIMPVYIAGHVGEADQIYKFAKKNKIRVIEDAAHAFGSVYKNKKVGSFGDISCFSFDGIKNITSGEGGCVVTNDKKILKKIRDARLLGVQRDTNKRFLGERSWDFDVKDQGWRYHMSDINASIGIVQLSRFNNLSAKRQMICKNYDNILSNNKKIIFFKRNYKKEVPHIYIIRIKNLRNKKLLRYDLINKGIETGVHYLPNYKLSKFKEKNLNKFKNTEKIFKEILTLPLHPEINLNTQKYIIKSINGLLNKQKYYKN